MKPQHFPETSPEPLPVAQHASAEAGAQMVVGIGASAGGLKALQQLVEAIPADSGLAYVVILHLDPERESRMRELLQDRANVPVTQVRGSTSVEANHIYIIPPGQDLTIRGTTLELRTRAERSAHLPVDLFFRTLAEAYGPDAVGVVLSGTGTDGTAGIRFIRQAGGITVAQSPAEAEYEGMPASAMSTGLIDLVLPSAEIPAALLRLRRPATDPADEAGGVATEVGVAPVLAALRSITGHDFSLYKRSTVLRRLDRRLRFNGAASVEEYLPVLLSSASEAEALLRDLLISVSSFFRDPDAFETLAALAPKLFEGKGAADAVRVWVVGCATGEEVYSIAMVLAEHAATLSDPPRLQLFATDIDEQGYAWARAGVYTAAAVASISPERLRRFFTKEAGGYRIAKTLREQVLFAGHNVLHDPPFSRMDLISCRNLFIYLQAEAQQRILETFHFALKPEGLLFLGAAETAGDSGLFVADGGAEHKLYRRGVMSHRALPRLSAADPQPRPGNAGAAAPASGMPETPDGFSYGGLHLRMLDQYAAASAVVDERLEVMHLSAGFGRFLRMREGEPTRNLLELVADEVRSPLRTALHEAFRTRTPSRRRITTSMDGVRQRASVEVRPATAEDGNRVRFALVVFEAEDEHDVSSPVGTRDEATPASTQLELEAELRRTHELLASTSMAHDRTVAELQTVNEELRSINEEQKAAAEELETSREEIQSINEELTTINQEHQSTIEELKRTNADLQNLIESTEIGTIFLDRGMRIRRFTPAAAALFNFVTTDQGRPFGHITHRLTYGELLTDVSSVLTTLERIEREVSSDTGETYIMRITPYRAVDGGSDGVVLTFFDNTVQHRIQEQLRAAMITAESANLAKGTFLATLSHEFRTPLNAILGFADLMSLDGPLTAAQEMKIERIKAGGWHLVAMIEEILSFARLDGGHEVVAAARFDARQTAREAGALVEPAAAAKRLTFALDVPSTDVWLNTDAGKVRQILINLCGNAVKYTEAGTIRLGVRTEGTRVVFEVRDTGIGIARDDHDRIFDRFWQVDGGATRSAGGMGIGLAAAREYARLLGGDVEVASELGRGATFSLWLPLEDG